MQKSEILAAVSTRNCQNYVTAFYRGDVETEFFPNFSLQAQIQPTSKN